MLRTFYTGSYKKPRQFTWFTGVILLLVTLTLSFSGYLLPWDQLALWAVTIGASMVEATPPAELVGSNLNLLVRGGPDMGANGLLRFYLLHVLLLPLLLFIFTGVHYYKVIIHGHSLPPQKENIGEDTAKRVPLDKRVYFIPDVLTNEIMWIGTTTFVLVVLATWFFKAPLESHADPQNTPLHTLAPWYFLWIQGALKLGDKVFWGIVFPGLVFGFLAVMPYLDMTPSRRFADRRVALSVSYILLITLVVFSYFGLPTVGVATSGDTEVLAEMVPGEHPGVLRPLPFDQLSVGAYTTAQLHGDNPAAAIEEFTAHLEESGQGEMLRGYLGEKGYPSSNINFVPVPSSSPELLHALEEFEHLIEEFDDQLTDAWGVILINQDQENVKRVDVVINWQLVGEDAVEGERSINGDFTYIHEDSEWFER